MEEADDAVWILGIRHEVPGRDDSLKSVGYSTLEHGNISLGS